MPQRSYVVLDGDFMALGVKFDQLRAVLLPSQWRVSEVNISKMHLSCCMPRLASLSTSMRSHFGLVTTSISAVSIETNGV